MQRRDFLATLAAGTAAWGPGVPNAAAVPLVDDGGFLLSNTGCNAATADTVTVVDHCPEGGLACGSMGIEPKPL